MNFNWIKFLLNKHDKIQHNVIDLLDYHYKVDNIYDDLILVDIDVDDLDIERWQHIKLLNDVYVVRDIEYLPYNKEFKYRLTLLLKNKE